MTRKIRNIIAVLSIVLPFYMLTIIQKWLGTVDYSVQSILGVFLTLSLFGIVVVFLLNKYLLKNSMNAFAAQKGNILLDISMGFLLLCITYFVISFGNITYFKCFDIERDQSEVIALLSEIFANKFYTIIFLGPFIWISESFLALSKVLIMNCLWNMSSKKYWNWLVICLLAIMLAFTQIDKGMPTMINWFLISLAGNILYFKYRRIYPLLIAGIVLQSIDLISAWFYNFL